MLKKRREVQWGAGLGSEFVLVIHMWTELYHKGALRLLQWLRCGGMVLVPGRVRRKVCYAAVSMPSSSGRGKNPIQLETTSMLGALWSLGCFCRPQKEMSSHACT
ncbi:hypothetical protein ILYODFUR_013821 [Ilyodon furcidens]|uniref:Uncharacterized protein n=1 Tax=Ilyodon furcidens TaxID=33524 RepID=A0ABV0US16_9TELE